MQPRELMRATDVIRRIGSSFYFHPDTLARGRDAGLDRFPLYVLGRGGVLGDVEPGVVSAAFGYFNPTLIQQVWSSAKKLLSPRDAATLYIECAHHVGRSTFSELDGLDRFAAAASLIIGSVEDSSLPMFAGVRAEPVPTDAPAAAMHQAMVLRELRGSVHLLAVVASGLATPVAHAIKRPDDFVLFGYEQAPDVTDADRAKWHRAEELTDELLEPAYGSVSDAQADDLVAGTDAMAAALGL